jgi:hypothetical protein
MQDTDLFQLALGLSSPWTVTRSEFDAVDGRLDLYVDFPRGSRFACAQCGREGCAVHDTKEETWRHLDFFQHRTLLHARTPRATCPECGVRKAATPWARAGSGFTLLFEAYVLALAKTMPIANAALASACSVGAVRSHTNLTAGAFSGVALGIPRPLRLFEFFVEVHAPQFHLLDISLEPVSVDEAPGAVAISNVDDHPRLERSGQFR